jgi:serine/threonine protein kinase
MTLTPSTLRLDLKCGRGAISEGEKCHVGPATKVQEKSAAKKSESKGLTGKQKAQVAGLVAYAALGAASLYQLKNIRKAYSEKFDPAQRYKPFESTLGDPSDVLNNIARSDKQAGPSLFGDVSFGKYKDKDVVVKSFGKKGLSGSMQIRQMQQQGIISKNTADALVRGQNALQMNEVQGAFLAGQLGIGPKVVAAGNGTRRTLLGPERENVLVTEVAKGRPLSSQDALLRQGPKLQEQLQRNPGAAIKKIAALQWRGFTKGTEISSVNKDRIIRNLRKMHTMGMSHNDLHPGNIFISKEGAQFIDFGTSDRGGASVASEFVRLMNPPRTGLQQAGGMGYNLRSMDPAGYKTAEARIRQVIGKRVGKLTSADIQKALSKSKDKDTLEANLQRIVDEFYVQYGKRTDALTPASVRCDAARSKPCGESHIPAANTCHKRGGGMSTRKKAAIAAGLGAAALGIGALAYAGRRKRTQVGPVRVAPPSRPSRPQLPGTPEPDYPRLPGITPKGLLPPARKRKSKTQRMRENTAAAVTAAEQRIAQTAKEEVRRLGQIGNTMAAAGEAAGMATKTAARELRLRTEAARRRFEPGYRRPDQKRLPEGEQPRLTPGNVAPQREPLPIDPRTGQPRRRRARGFGRTDAADPCWKGYVQVGMKRKGGRRVPNCVPASSGVARPKAKSDVWATGFDTEDSKKYTKQVRDPKTGRTRTVRYGAKGYRIAPGTDKGDRYCARSFGDMKSEGYNCAGAERNTPLCLSRAKWRCSGKTSRRDGLTPGK